MAQAFSICEGDTVLLRCSETQNYVFSVAIRYVDVQMLHKCNSKSNCKLVYTCHGNVSLFLVKIDLSSILASNS